MIRKQILIGIAHLCLHHYRKVLLISLLLFSIAFLLTGRLRFDPDFLKLFPAEKGPIKVYMENLKEAKTFDLLFVLLEREEGTDLQSFLDSGKEIAEDLKRLEVDGKRAFRSLRYQRIEAEDLEGARPALALFLTHPYLFLEEKDMPLLKEKWSEEEIARQIRKNRRILVSQASFGMKDLIRLDPFEMRWHFMGKWRAGMKGMEFDESSNLFLSKDKNTLLIITEPARPATNLSFSNALMEALDRFVSSRGEKKIKVSFTGAHPIATSEAKTLRFDMQSSFISSLVLVLLLFFYAYRRWVTLLFVGLPLFGGIQLTMGIASLTLGRLNIMTSAFAAILVGLGIDFAIHLYDRYQQERSSGADLAPAIETTLTETGEGIWTGAFTTIVAFVVLYFSRVRGIMELAFLVSTGLLCALLCIYFVLPSFLIWIDQRKKPYSYPSLPTFQFNRLSSFLRRHPYRAISILIALTLFFAFFALRIEMERDFRNLRPKEIKSLEVLERMAKAFGGRRMEASAIHEGRDLSLLISKEERVVGLLEGYRQNGKIEAFASISQVVPSPEKQRRVVQAIRKAIDLEKVKNHLTRALNENGFEVNEFRPILQVIEEMRLDQEKIFPPDVLLDLLDRGPLKRGIEALLVKKGEAFKIISPIYYQKGRISLDSLERELPGISLTGPEKVESEILRIVREDLFLLTPIAFILILLLVFSHFRQWGITFLTLLPLATGLLWMIGAMVLLGIRINFVNAVILPMIIGMGIDNSIHLMHRYLEAGGKDPIRALRTTGRAMAMCSTTTMLGFGSLVTARYQALSTMGWVTILGMGFCLIASLSLLPSVLLLWKRKSDER